MAFLCPSDPLHLCSSFRMREQCTSGSMGCHLVWFSPCMVPSVLITLCSPNFLTTASQISPFHVRAAGLLCLVQWSNNFPVTGLCCFIRVRVRVILCVCVLLECINERILFCLLLLEALLCCFTHALTCILTFLANYLLQLCQINLIQNVLYMSRFCNDCKIRTMFKYLPHSVVAYFRVRGFSSLQLSYDQI